MKWIQRGRKTVLLQIILIFSLFYTIIPGIVRADLKDVQQQGVLRHLGVTYAHFIKKTPQGYDGLDVDVMRLFAKHLGVKYQFISTTWSNLFTDLTGRKLNPATGEYDETSTEEIKGDIISNGLTVLPNRQKIVNYSVPTFPTGIWLIAPANSPIKPIQPSENIEKDIENVKNLLKGHSVLTMSNTCLDANFFHFDPNRIDVKFFTTSKIINDIVPAVINGVADTTLLDIPDAMITLQQWPGEIKIIGPVSSPQIMGAAVPKDSPELLEAFNLFFKQIWNDGTYRSLVEKYYPSVFLYFNTFFDTDR